MRLYCDIAFPLTWSHPIIPFALSGLFYISYAEIKILTRIAIHSTCKWSTGHQIRNLMLMRNPDNSEVIEGESMPYTEILSCHIKGVGIRDKCETIL